MENIAIFASGNGTNCANIIKYFSKSTEINIRLVITNNPKAKVIERAEALGTTVITMTKDEISDSQKLLPVLEKYEIEYIVLAGFLLFIPDFLVRAYSRHIINIHPSLLPKYGGKGMYGIHVHEAVKANGEKESGITIHYINNEYDKGEIIAQYSTEITEQDTAEDIATKVHAIEYKYFPPTIERIIREK